MSYRIRFHPAVADDLDAILRWIIDYAGPNAGARKFSEIEIAISEFKLTPHKGSLRDEIAPGLRAIQAGRKAVVAFTVDDATREVFVHASSYAGARWITGSRTRGR